MLCNIIDSRSRRYRWRRVEAILEATAHDNGCADADQVEPSRHDILLDSATASRSPKPSRGRIRSRAW